MKREKEKWMKHCVVSVEQSLRKALQIKLFNPLVASVELCNMQNAWRIQLHPNCHTKSKPKACRPIKAFCCTQDLGWTLLYLGFPSTSTVFALWGASWETARHNQSSRTDSGCRRDLRRDDLENKTQKKPTSFKHTRYGEVECVCINPPPKYGCKIKYRKAQNDFCF